MITFDELQLEKRITIGICKNDISRNIVYAWKEREAISQSNERYDPDVYTRMHRAIENKFLE